MVLSDRRALIATEHTEIKVFPGIFLFILMMPPSMPVWSQVAPGDVANSSAATPLSSQETSPTATRAPTENIPIGTVITTRNWQSYKQYMPEGMRMLFEGRFAWKIPSDIQMEIGP